MSPGEKHDGLWHHPFLFWSGAMEKSECQVEHACTMTQVTHAKVMWPEVSAPWSREVLLPPLVPGAEGGWSPRGGERLTWGAETRVAWEWVGTCVSPCGEWVVLSTQNNYLAFWIALLELSKRLHENLLRVPYNNPARELGGSVYYWGRGESGSGSCCPKATQSIHSGGKIRTGGCLDLKFRLGWAR